MGLVARGERSVRLLGGVSVLDMGAMATVWDRLVFRDHVTKQ